MLKLVKVIYLTYQATFGSSLFIWLHSGCHTIQYAMVCLCFSERTFQLNFWFIKHFIMINHYQYINLSGFGWLKVQSGSKNFHIFHLRLNNFQTYNITLLMTGPCQMLAEMVFEAFKRFVAKEKYYYQQYITFITSKNNLYKLIHRFITVCKVFFMNDQKYICTKHSCYEFLCMSLW